ncbi:MULTISPECIES: porin [Massilia]|uniref:porin n=1 Tax=Massilia TaxID=149698 RepID=UPI0025550EE0|nr:MULTISPECIES: porin [Massilia]MDK6076460.1 porin [Massilia varians]
MSYLEGQRRKAMLAGACLAGFLSAPACAQGNVTVYGIVDAALARISNANAEGKAVTKVPSLTGSLPSRIGFRGEEALGKGLSAVFAVEAGFGPDTGLSGQGNRLFGRQAWVGLKGGWGTLQLGRVMNMTYLSTARSDVLGPALFSISSIDLYLPNARSDNALAYVGNFKGWTVGASYSLGRDASSAGGAAATGCPGELAADDDACRQITALLGYETDAFGINAVYDRMRGGPGAANGLTSSANTDRRVGVNAYVMLGRTKLGGGMFARTTDAAPGRTESDLYYLGVSHPLSASLTLDAQVARKAVDASADDSNLMAARLTYAFSKRTAVYGAVGRMDNRGQAAIALDVGGSAAPGRTQNGIMAGLRHSF